MQLQLVLRFAITALLGVSTALSVPEGRLPLRNIIAPLNHTNPVNGTLPSNPTTISHPATTTVTVHARAFRTMIPSAKSEEHSPSYTEKSSRAPSSGGFTLRKIVRKGVTEGTSNTSTEADDVGDIYSEEDSESRYVRPRDLRTDLPFLFYFLVIGGPIGFFVVVAAVLHRYWPITGSR